MTALEERKTLIGLISEATLAGARQAPACGILGLSERTVQRWLCGEPDAVEGRSSRCYEPSHKLSANERAELLAVANSAEFGRLPPSQIVPRLADQQRYIASESTFYRILREERQLAHRRSEQAPRSCSKPRAVAADAPNQLYSWDITYLPSAIRGQYFYLYLFIAEGVWKLFSDGCRRVRQPDQPSLADRGGAYVTYRAQKSPSGP